MFTLTGGNMLRNTQIWRWWCVPSRLFWFQHSVWNDSRSGFMLAPLGWVWINTGVVKDVVAALCEKGLCQYSYRHNPHSQQSDWDDLHNLQSIHSLTLQHSAPNHCASAVVGRFGFCVWWSPFAFSTCMFLPAALTSSPLWWASMLLPPASKLILPSSLKSSHLCLWWVSIFFLLLLH